MSVADLVKAALGDLGLRAIIVSEEARRPGPSWEPEAKVDSFLRSSEAFVALVTPDDELTDGNYQCRPNVIDEIGRARNDPRLRDAMMIVKAPDVAHLWSNINPTYDHLDVADVGPAINAIVLQLRTWGILPSSGALARPAIETSLTTVSPTAEVAALLAGLALGDHDEAAARSYVYLLLHIRAEHEAVVFGLFEFMTSTDDTDQLLIASSVLEAIARLDPSLIPVARIEELALSTEFALRSCAAMLLWQWAESDPGRVSLPLLGRLAVPSAEDWYVQAPAMAAAKQLITRRADARWIFDALALSRSAEDRHAVVSALRDVARVAPWAVPMSLAKQLAQDADESISRGATELMQAIEDVSDEERRRHFGLFGL